MNSNLNSEHARQALRGLRFVVGGLLFIHGAARLWMGIVDDFGVFLDAVGFPFGVALAWFLTVVELVGGVALILGQLTRVLAIYFAAQLTLGIILVHAQEGWFVVGAGRNGMEYSVLLIAVLLAVAFATPRSGSRP